MKRFILLVGVGFLVSACGVEMVDTGHRGVKTHYGKVIENSLPEDIYFYNPFTQDIIEMSVRTETHEYKTVTYTKDIQQATVTAVLMANLDKDLVYLMYRDYGRDWQKKLLQPTFEGALKNVIGKWDAVDLIGNREKARMEVENYLKTNLKERNVELVKFEITNIEYEKGFEKAVENKVIAIQAAKEAENKTKQIQEEAKQKVISAKAEAESMSIRANALSRNKSLVDYEAVQKWDGHLPQYMLGETTPFINIGKSSENIPQAGSIPNEPKNSTPTTLPRKSP